MAYTYNIPAEGNLVRTASGDLVLMQKNYEYLLGLASGIYNDGTAPDTALRGLYFGRSGYRNRFKIESDGSNVFRLARNVGSAGSPSWQNVLSFSQVTAAELEAAYPIAGQTPTNASHLTTKAYVDGLGATLSGLTDTTITAPADGASLVWDTGTSKWIDSLLTYALNDLTDVVAPSPTSGYSLVWNGGQWIASGVSGVTTLSGLTDTNITSPADGAVLTWDTGSSKWIDGSAPAQTLSGLTDTTITNPADGAVLTWDDGTSKWIDGTAPPQTLAGLTDTTISGPTSGQHLIYNGSAWVNEDVVSGSRVAVALSGTQTIAQNTPTVMSGTLEAYNAGGWGVSNGTVTVPDGITRVDILGQASWAASATGTDYIARILVNGSSLSGLAGYNLGAMDHRRKSTSNDVAVQQVVAFDVPVASGDTIELEVSQDGVANLNLEGRYSGQDTWLAVREVGGGGSGGGGGGSSTLSGLTDTTITNPVTDAGFKWNGSAWIDTTPAASGVGLVESFDLVVESVTSGDAYTVSLYAFYPYDVKTLVGKTTNGTCDLVFNIGATGITGLSGITVSGTQTTWNASATNSVALEDTLSIQVTDATACSGLTLSLKTERT